MICRGLNQTYQPMFIYNFYSLNIKCDTKNFAFGWYDIYTFEATFSTKVHRVKRLLTIAC